ncbi:MAG: hypothetical protein K0R38_238 [Polyangiaceae bacterium]|jgi:uncharacterized protein (DUF1501 family)|nr:hypothetical protein [Polyangiaceae bacterium]
MSRSYLSRRALLGGTLLASTSVLLHGNRSFAAEPVSGRPVLLCVFLRGAADGLNIVVPHAEPEYYKLRPSIAVPPPDKTGGAIDLDGRFGFNPRLMPLKAAFDAKELAVVHAVGSPHPTRSHFEAQDYMQTGAVGNRSAVHGWLGRYLASRPEPNENMLRALALSSRAPLSLRGYRDALVTESLKEFRLGVRGELQPVLSRGFTRLYEGEEQRLAERAGKRALGASALVARVLSEQKKGGKYPREAQDFQDVAKLIKADVGLETAWIDLGGWDTHRYQGSSERGELPQQLERLAQALAAFRADLGPAFERVLVVVMSEFGRTARENGTGGTDHGHGNAMLLLGGKVQGGRVLGSFPGLEPEHLFESRDVPVTTDFRDVLAEACERHLGMSDASPLFPGYELDRKRRLGFI